MLIVSIFIDLFLFVVTGGFSANETTDKNVFIPFEEDGMNYDPNAADNNSPDGSQHYPDDFGGEF